MDTFKSEVKNFKVFFIFTGYSFVSMFCSIVSNVKIAHWADEFSTDALREMLSIICKCRSSK